MFRQGCESNPTAILQHYNSNEQQECMETGTGADLGFA